MPCITVPLEGLSHLPKAGESPNQTILVLEGP